MIQYGDTIMPAIPVVPVPQEGLDRWLPWRRPCWRTTEEGLILGRKIPEGAVFNGASIPFPLNLLYSPGKAWFYAALLHDLECGEHTGEPLTTWADAARRFYNAMRCYGTPQYRAFIFYQAVRLNGWIKRKN